MSSLGRFFPSSIRGWIGGLVPVTAFVILNAKQYWDFYHPQRCFDCGVRIGMPFAFWRSETFVGGNEVIELGLLGDIMFGVVLLVVGAMCADRVSYGQKRTASLRRRG